VWRSRSGFSQPPNGHGFAVPIVLLKIATAHLSDPFKGLCPSLRQGRFGVSLLSLRCKTALRAALREVITLPRIPP
jgi:hypothetical protein